MGLRRGRVRGLANTVGAVTTTSRSQWETDRCCCCVYNTRIFMTEKRKEKRPRSLPSRLWAALLPNFDDLRETVVHVRPSAPELSVSLFSWWMIVIWSKFQTTTATATGTHLFCALRAGVGCGGEGGTGGGGAGGSTRPVTARPLTTSWFPGQIDRCRLRQLSDLVRSVLNSLR